MNKVFFLSDIKLENPTRGTPIHIARLLTELRREHDIVVCATSVPETLRDVFIPYPRETGWRKLRSLLGMLDTHKPKTILTTGQIGLLAPVLLKILRKVRIVVELHGVEHVEKRAAGHIGLWHFYFWKYKTILLLPWYDVVIGFTKSTAGLYPFLRKFKTMYPAIDVETVPQASVQTIPPLIAGYSGNMDIYQGLHHLIAAVALVRKRGLDARLHLILSGDDGKLAKVRAQIEELNLADITTIVRNVLQHQAQKEMMNTSVQVIPRENVTESKYGFPGKLPECLATGIPVIMTNIGAVSELMPEISKYAIVIPAENITNHLANALHMVGGMSIYERRQLGDSARTYAKKFSWENCIPIVSEAL